MMLSSIGSASPQVTHAMLGFGELAIIAGILLFFFGAKRLPEIARGLGGGIRSFKDEIKQPEEEPEDRLPPPAEGDARRD